MIHDDTCPRPFKKDCLQFSTDGTRMGAEIAHTMGTTDEEKIKRNSTDSLVSFEDAKDLMTGMDAEQAEWDSEDASAWQ